MKVDNTTACSNSAYECGDATQPNAHKCRCSPGTMNQQCDSAFKPTVHKCDANAEILAHNITQESPVLDYFELFLPPDVMNITAIET